MFRSNELYLSSVKSLCEKVVRKDSHIKWDICVMWQAQHMRCIWQRVQRHFNRVKCLFFALVTVARRIKNNYYRCRLTISAIAILSKFRSYCTFSAPEWFRWKMSSCRKCTNLFLLRPHWIHILPNGKTLCANLIISRTWFQDVHKMQRHSFTQS